MGYHTDFAGSFSLDKPLMANQREYLQMFSHTRRMQRYGLMVENMKNKGKGNKRCFELLGPLGLPIGHKGEFYCGEGFAGQDKDDSIVDYNTPPSSQPGLWCQWVPNIDGTKIEWDKGTKFYHYTEWLKYLISNFLTPWGYKVNGMVEWRGESMGDIGVIEVVDNVVTVHENTTIECLKNERVKAQSTHVPTVNTSDIILDLVKLRNELASAKKGTAVACKKIDALIKKYGI
jgi:hypothetical protein